jgi:hypothetical protein
MSTREPWTVYGSAPPPVTVRSERAAGRLARKYGRLGIRASLYSPGPNGELVQRSVIGGPGVPPGPRDHDKEQDHG